MNENVKPKVIISKCIEFDFCRFNGQIIRNEFINKSKNYIDYIPICPEVEIGLGIPRNPIRIVEENNKKQLIQPANNKNITNNMNDFCNNFLNSLNDIDGFILKSQSPSCGIKDVKIYPHMNNSAPKYRDSGFFGNKVIEKYGYLAIEDENRLRNTLIKEHFLRKIFTLSKFRNTSKLTNIKDLIDFHTKNKYLLMSYNQKNLKEMGNLVANHTNEPINTILEKYQNLVYNTFSKGMRCNSNVNILQHAYGYISKKISSKEKKLFFDQIENYRNKKIPLEIPLAILKSWIIRFDESYLKKQTFFEPYPIDLHEPEAVNICPSKDYWK